MKENETTMRYGSAASLSLDAAAGRERLEGPLPRGPDLKNVRESGHAALQ